MPSLYLDHSIGRIAREGQSLALYLGQHRQGSIPLRHIDRLILRGNITLASGLLAHLADQGIGVLMLGGRFGDKLASVQGMGHADAARRIAQASAYRDDHWRLDWSRRLMALKLRSQQRLLHQALRQRPDLRRALTQGSDSLQRIHDQLAQAGSLASLLGLEGAAAAVYFAALSQLFPPALDFSGRNRRPPRDPVNAVLSLGYTLLHHDAERALHQAGLDPLIGFYHSLAYNRASLAADLIEPLRARFDRLCWQLFRDRTLRNDHFSRQQGGCLLEKTGRQHFYAAYEPWARAVRRLLLRQGRQLCNQLIQTFPVPSRSEGPGAGGQRIPNEGQDIDF